MTTNKYTVCLHVGNQSSFMTDKSYGMTFEGIQTVVFLSLSRVVPRWKYILFDNYHMLDGKMLLVRNSQYWILISVNFMMKETYESQPFKEVPFPV